MKLNLIENKYETLVDKTTIEIENFIKKNNPDTKINNKKCQGNIKKKINKLKKSKNIVNSINFLFKKILKK